MARSLITLILAMLPLSASAQSFDCGHIPTSAGAVDPAYVACAQPTAPTAEASPGFTHFGINNAADQFVRFDPTNPGNLTPVGPYTPPNGAFLNAGDFRGEDPTTWYGLDNLGQAIAVNTTTGAVTPLGTLGANWTALAWSVQANTFFGWQSPTCGSGTDLYRVDFQAMTATFIGSDGGAAPCGIGLGVRPFSGELYGYDIVTDNLLRIDAATGAATVVGPLGFNANFGQGMDFDGLSGTCYLYAFNSETMAAELRTCNTSTGATTLVGRLGTGLQQLGSASSESLDYCEGPSLDATVDDLTPTPGQVLTFTVTVSNCFNSPSPLDLWFEAFRNGQQIRRAQLGSGMVPAHTSVTRTVPVRVPSGTPVGPYHLSLIIGHFPTDNEADSQPFTLTVSAPLTGDSADVLPFETDVADFFAADATTNAPPTLTLRSSPNPTREHATLRYTLGADAPVRLVIYDALGREVAVLMDRDQEAGTHAATFDARGLPAGVYVVRLTAGREVRTERVTVLR